MTDSLVETEATTVRSSSRLGRRALLAVSVIVIAIAYGLRAWIVGGPLGSINADEAVSGLMARALLDGEFSTFYWQQHYGGTVEIVPLAALIATVGDTAALVVMPIVESLVIGALVFVLARRRLEDPTAVAVVALAAVFPAASVWFTTRAMLFYQPVMILGLGALVVAEQLTDDELSDRGRLVRWGVLGLLLGLGWWTSSQIMFYALAALGWLALRRGMRHVVEPAIGAVAAIVGAAPWLLHNVRTSWASVREVPGGNGGYLDHLSTQIQIGWPMSVGVRRPFDERWLVHGWGPVFAIVAVAAGVGVAVTFVRRRSIRSPLAGVLLSFPLVHALAPSGDYVGTGRYYIFIMAPIAYAVVAALSTVPHARRWVTAALVTASAATVWTLYDLRDVRPGPAGIDALNDVVTDLGIEHVYGDYWTAYMMSWDDDDIISSPNIFDRRPDWSLEVRAAPEAAYVFNLSSAAERARYADLLPRLRAAVGVDDEVDVGTFRVVVPTRNVPPELLPALDTTREQR